ncbi:hypothetical protein JZU69_01720 [bacterium]|nr:hypothetical protein [bacterium]
MILFIRKPDQPVAMIEGVKFEFANNALRVDDGDDSLLWHLRAYGFEEVPLEDQRHGFIITEGWSRHAQADYARRFPAEG